MAKASGTLHHTEFIYHIYSYIERTNIVKKTKLLKKISSQTIYRKLRKYSSEVLILS